MRGREVYFEYKNKVLNFEGIRKILSFVSAVRNRFRGAPAHLLIDMGDVVAADKLSITMLESIAYALIVEYKHRVTMRFKVKHTIYTECIQYSPLRHLGNPTSENIQRFLASFAFDMQMDHFRKVLPSDAASSGTLSFTVSDVQMFLKHRYIDSEYSARLAEVISELIGNATEHSRTSCLLDIDFTSSEYKKNSELEDSDVKNRYMGVSVSLISFSGVSFEEGVRNKLGDIQELSGRYALVAAAYEKHEKYFGKNYTPADFYRIVAFQDRITGRPGETTSGGTGLTTLVKSLADCSDSVRCYLLAGNRILVFDKKFLDHNGDGWIGFNMENDFLNFPPDWHILQESPIVMPGVAYNLNFVCKKESLDENDKLDV